ncbi:MAG: hypothetical protein KJ065_28420, partial [Anaerolineae bacterium]|nr:hypothetical protein [Anaerolineae bacterium]
MPNDSSVRRAADKAARQAERLQERQSAEQYYERVGSRHPHIWPITGIGSAVYLVCIAATAFAVYQLGGAAPELAENPVMRAGIAAAAGAAAWFVLTVIRYTMFPEIRP